MIVREAKLLNGTEEQYRNADDAIRTAQFIRNKAIRYWMDNQGVGKSDLYTLCKVLAHEFPFAKKLNSAARQASVERAWASISSFYSRCKKKDKKKGFPTFKKHCRSVEYKVSGWKLSEDCMSINFTDGFSIGNLSLYCNKETREDLFRLKINRVRVVRRADGYYAQFCFDADRKEQGEYTGNVIGLDLGLKYFYKDQNDNEVIYPQFLRKSERKLKKAQRRLSKKFVKGKKPQSNNYHKASSRVSKIHLKIQRQRKDWAIKKARCVVALNDVVVYEDLKVANMVKNHHLAKSISDASWYQFTQWLDYYGKIWDKAVVAVSPNYTSQDCSNCGHRVKKSLSTRTHSCPNCKIEICLQGNGEEGTGNSDSFGGGLYLPQTSFPRPRGGFKPSIKGTEKRCSLFPVPCSLRGNSLGDTNAAINILSKGMGILGIEWQNSTQGHWESGSEGRKHGEKTTSTIDGKPDIASGLH